MGFLKDWRKLQCGFCDKRDDAVKKRNEGPQVLIGNERVNIWLEILVDGARTTVQRGATGLAFAGGS